MYILLKMVVFHCYVSLPEGIQEGCLLADYATDASAAGRAVNHGDGPVGDPGGRSDEKTFG